MTTNAWAGGRKRIVVLDLEGPKADKFHDDIVQIIKKSHIVVPTAKWNSTAEFLDAGAVNEKNFQKIAKKLKVDGIVSGKIEKRRDEYIIRLKLRAGTSGEVIGNGVDTKAEGPRIDGKSGKDIKDELLGQIDQLDGNHEGGAAPSKEDDDDDDKPAAAAAKKTPPPPAAKKEDPKKKVAAKKDDDDDDDKPAVKKAAPAAKKEDPKKKVAAKKDDDDDDDDKPAAKKAAPAAKKDDPKKKVAAKKADDDDDDKPAAKKTAKKDDAKKDDDDDSTAKKKSSDDDDDGSAKKKVATAEDDDTSISKSSEPKLGVTAAQLAPATRGLDVAVGLSLMERKFAFTSNLAAMVKPPGYHQAAPVPAAYVDATLYPLGLSHGGGTLANIGIGFTLDKVLGLQSQITNPDGTQVKEPTTEQRYAINVSYRIPFSSGGMAAVVVGYGSQHFAITRGADAVVDIPDVLYTGLSPQALLRYPLGAKLYLDLDAGAMLLTTAGQIQQNDQYGQATVLGITADVGIDYMLTKSLFARVTGRFETVGLSFKGTGAMATSRDGIPSTIDVTAARDNYFGGTLTVGYAY